jgi:hypothetical protein
MRATRELIEEWFLIARKRKATHMLTVFDTFDHVDFPVFVEKGVDPRAVYDKYHRRNMYLVMEVYSLSMPLEPQLDEPRAMHFRGKPRQERGTKKQR